MKKIKKSDLILKNGFSTVATVATVTLPRSTRVVDCHRSKHNRGTAIVEN